MADEEAIRKRREEDEEAIRKRRREDEAAILRRRIEEERRQAEERRAREEAERRARATPEKLREIFARGAGGRIEPVREERRESEKELQLRESVPGRIEWVLEAGRREKEIKEAEEEQRRRLLSREFEEAGRIKRLAGVGGTPVEKETYDRQSKELNELIEKINKRRKPDYILNRLESLRENIKSIDNLPFGERITKLRTELISEARDILRELERPTGATGGPPEPPRERPPPEGRPPAPPEGRREEREERGYGSVYGKVSDKNTKKPIKTATVTAFSTEAQVSPIPKDVSSEKGHEGEYEITVPTATRGILYVVYAEAPNYKRSRREQVVVKPGDRQEKNFDLEPEKKPVSGIFRKGKITQPWTLLSPDWVKENWLRVLLALGITLAIYFWLYRPLISGIGIEGNPIMEYVLPLLFFPLILFTIIPRKTTEFKEWIPLLLGATSAIGAWIGLQFFAGIELAPFIKYGVPLIFGFVVGYLTKKNIEGGKGVWRTLSLLAGLMALGGIGMFLYGLITGGGLTDIETYLKPFDILHLVGVPQDTIDNMKGGVRDVLSFLQFKGAEPVKPEAKKIGGFEAIQLKFGSRHNNYLLPTLFARMEYTLPVTVVNPNPLTSQLKPVGNFYIDEIFIVNKSDQKTICGQIGACSKFKDGKGNDISSRCSIGPEEEKLISIDFNGRYRRVEGGQSDSPGGTPVDCKNVVKSYRGSTTEKPLYPVTFRQDGVNVQSNEVCNKKEGESKLECQKDICKTECGQTLQKSNAQYGVSNELDERSVKYIQRDDLCECKVNRIYNILDDLCFMDRDKAEIVMRSHYDFAVEGKGELILVQKEGDRKLAPKPSITSGSGPLTITTYFVTDVFVKESQQTVKMFIQIDNDGDGTATMKGMSIFGTNISRTAEIPIGHGIKINNCSQDPSDVQVDDVSHTILCDVSNLGEVTITGSYLTVPVIVDANYTYSQKHSTSLSVKKASIPDGVEEGSDEEKELNTQFRALPYYCPTREVGGVTPLVIYKPECRDLNNQACTYLSPLCEWGATDKICKDKTTQALPVTPSSTPSSSTPNPTAFGGIGYCQSKGQCDFAQGGCKTDNECLPKFVTTEENKLKCTNVGLTVNVCCYPDQIFTECKTTFENKLKQTQV